MHARQTNEHVRAAPPRPRHHNGHANEQAGAPGRSGEERPFVGPPARPGHDAPAGGGRAQGSAVFRRQALRHERAPTTTAGARPSSWSGRASCSCSPRPPAPYDPDADLFVQDELAAEERAAAEEARQEWDAFDTRARERSYVLADLETAGLLDEREAERLGAKGPLIVCEPEDLAACDHINERGNRRLAAILEGRELRPPKDPDAVPASVRAHSALLTAMARNGSVGMFDAGHAVRLAQADPDAVLALAAWIDGRTRSSR